MVESLAPPVGREADYQLRQRVDQLEQELDSRNNPAEIDKIRQEWHTSEELLQQSQR